VTADNPNLADPLVPEIDSAIWQLRPDFAALSIVVRGGRNGPSEPPRAGRPPVPPWAEAHLRAWREAYQAFGAKPKRTPCSAEALARRLERDGSLPRVNAVVDLYNSLSLEFMLPIGGEDLAAYVGTPRLLRAAGGEPFATTRDGQPCLEPADPGEVIWRDDQGVTCRRWNWRQSVRTRLDVDATAMWFVLERLDPMPLTSLSEAGDRLVRELQRLAPSARVSSQLISANSGGR
jgi:DNA/RNA-binding domain of Phe-tRNA-synthetase-like protein